MSGQLVGEVIDAAEAGHLDDLSPNAFAALIVIADRAHTDTRQGSVRAGRIAVAIRRPNAPWSTTSAGSQSTVERAVKELKAAGWVRVVKRGFNNNHGNACAPIYEVCAFPSPRMTGTVDGVSVTQDDGNGDGAFPSNHRPFPSKRGGVPVTQGDDLTGFLDGSIDGGSAGESEPALSDPVDQGDDTPENQPDSLGHAAPATAGPPPTPDELTAAADLPAHPDDWLTTFEEPEPSRHCPDHPNDTDEVCRPCERARNRYPAAHAKWVNDAQAFAKGRADAKRKWRYACRQCDNEHGDTLGPDGRVLDDVAAKCTHPRLRRAYVATHPAADALTSPTRATRAAS